MENVLDDNRMPFLAYQIGPEHSHMATFFYEGWTKRRVSLEACENLSEAEVQRLRAPKELLQTLFPPRGDTRV